ncbi:tetratricopeptide repeat protein [Halobacillus naozhouensis]|uniref:Tetratricopeptide repeat-containing protein n=1 Tax=Halobacillus naozhouensis TaxID=554880 RepID=A0ABY8IUQ6_9BACI|nr:hypothetical protein [Halobacillus naozhouensis]WFT73863.1 hypothetical protein P9989_16020 [Halobacillus naozhouensis]
MVAQVHTVDLFSELTIALRNYNQEESTQLLAELEREFPDSSLPENNSDLCAKYILIARYHIQYGDIQAAYTKLLLARNQSYKFNEGLHYMYAYVSALYEVNKKNYPKALKWYTQAEKYLYHNKDPLETADFYYRKATLHYFMEGAIESMLCLEQAIRIYKDDSCFHSSKIAHCELIQGLNYIDLKNYDLAEEFFHLSLSHKGNDIEFETSIYHNLAHLYSKKNLPKTSLRYIEKSLEREDSHPDLSMAYFLLTKELLKISNRKKGKELCERGLVHSKEANDLIHFHLYTILKELYLAKNAEERSLNCAISFLQKNNKWITIEDFSDEIASYYYDRDEFELASKYFNISLQAKNLRYGRC